jgi:hypothetical protein
VKINKVTAATTMTAPIVIAARDRCDFPVLSDAAPGIRKSVSVSTSGYSNTVANTWGEMSVLKTPPSTPPTEIQM